ncbi:hypothetical protein B0T12DRAFT_250524 [Alternaria alternata]|nr:hypothetical protein B0T12DRAFT_250524 [Alternaria alternata]
MARRSRQLDRLRRSTSIYGIVVIVESRAFLFPPQVVQGVDMEDVHTAQRREYKCEHLPLNLSCKRQIVRLFLYERYHALRVTDLCPVPMHIKVGLSPRHPIWIYIVITNKLSTRPQVYAVAHLCNGSCQVPSYAKRDRFDTTACIGDKIGGQWRYIKTSYDLSEQDYLLEHIPKFVLKVSIQELTYWILRRTSTFVAIIVS